MANKIPRRCWSWVTFASMVQAFLFIWLLRGVPQGMKELLLCSIWISATAQSKTTKCMQSCVTQTDARKHLQLPARAAAGYKLYVAVQAVWSGAQAGVCVPRAQQPPPGARRAADARRVPCQQAPETAARSPGADLQNGNRSEGTLRWRQPVGEACALWKLLHHCERSRPSTSDSWT